MVGTEVRSVSSIKGTQTRCIPHVDIALVFGSCSRFSSSSVFLPQTRPHPEEFGQDVAIPGDKRGLECKFVMPVRKQHLCNGSPCECSSKPRDHDEVLEARLLRLQVANCALLSAGVKSGLREKVDSVILESQHLRLILAIPGLPQEVRRAIAAHVFVLDIDAFCATEQRVLNALLNVHGHAVFEHAGACGYRCIFCDTHWADEYSDMEHDYNSLMRTHCNELKRVLQAVQRYAFSTYALGLDMRASSAGATCDVMRNIIDRGSCLRGPLCRTCGYSRMERTKFWECARRGRLSVQDLQVLRRHLAVIRDREEISTDFDMRILIERLPDEFVDAWSVTTLSALKRQPQLVPSSTISITRWEGFVQDVRQCPFDGRRSFDCLTSSCVWGGGISGIVATHRQYSLPGLPPH